MGWLDLLKGVGGMALGAAQSWLNCPTLPQQSQVRIVLGEAGPETFQSIVYFNSDIDICVNSLKIMSRILGVYDPSVTGALLNNMKNQAGINGPSMNMGTLEAAEKVNPPLTSITLNQWALIVVRSELGKENFHTDSPYTQFTFDSLQDKINVADPRDSPAYSNITTIPDLILWYVGSVFYGPFNPWDTISGFKLGGYPGPVVLQKGDYIALIHQGSSNFYVPQSGLCVPTGLLFATFSFDVSNVIPGEEAGAPPPPPAAAPGPLFAAR